MEELKKKYLRANPYLNIAVHNYKWLNNTLQKDKEQTMSAFDVMLSQLDKGTTDQEKLQYI